MKKYLFIVLLVGFCFGQDDKPKKDCYLDGVEQAKIDFQSEGFVNGLGCGIVPIFGYIIGSLIVNITDVDTPYGLYRNLEGDCRMDYDMGYKEEAKKLKKKNFNQGILVSTGIFIVANYLADAQAKATSY